MQAEPSPAPAHSHSLPMQAMQLPVVQALPALMAMTPPQLQDLLAMLHQGSDVARIHMQMFYVFLLLNQHEAALDMQTRALRLQRAFHIAGSAAPLLRLLVVMGPGAMQDNTPIEFVLQGSAVQTQILYLLPGEELPVLPQHDISFIAIGESDKNASLLAQLDAAMARWPTPVINAPRGIAHCARERCYALLKDIDGLRMAQTLRVKAGAAIALDFPFTLRPVDTQGGEGLQRIDDAAALEVYYADHPAPSYYAAQYLDYQAADGLYRKLRIVLIAGVPYICHMAISDHWMVHYLSAGMAQSADKRLQEQRVMEGFDQDFAARHQAALRAIAHALQLDYVTIDCAQGADGRLLVFEADSRGLIHAGDPVELYPYKPAVMQKAFDAFEALLLQRVGAAAQADSA